jgi:hypothetical protein
MTIKKTGVCGIFQHLGRMMINDERDELKI